jgi:hypothetical protein
MKIGQSETGTFAALEGRSIEGLRERVRSRVEAQTRLLRSAQAAHREFAPANASVSVEKPKAPIEQLLADVYREQQLKREIKAQVEASLDAIGVTTNADAPVQGDGMDVEAAFGSGERDDGHDVILETSASLSSSGQAEIMPLTTSAWTSSAQLQWSRAQAAYSRWH